MGKAKSSFVLEITGISLIRILCIVICAMFFFPMFKMNYEVFSSQSVTGFESILGDSTRRLYGNPIALISFLYPIFILFVSMFSFLYKKLYLILSILGIIGFLLSIVYFISQALRLRETNIVFGREIWEMRTSMTFVCLLIVIVYITIIIMSFVCSRVADYD